MAVIVVRNGHITHRKQEEQRGGGVAEEEEQTKIKTQTENGERRLLIWQFASGLLSIFAYISMTWGVNKTDARFCSVALSYSRIRRQNKADAPDHQNIKETNLASAVCSFADLLVVFCLCSNKLGCKKKLTTNTGFC
jgi:hypothetical protein